jgi:hypothetical protein
VWLWVYLTLKVTPSFWKPSKAGQPPPAGFFSSYKIPDTMGDSCGITLKYKYGLFGNGKPLGNKVT